MLHRRAASFRMDWIVPIVIAIASLAVQLLQWLSSHRPQKAIDLSPQSSVKLNDSVDTLRARASRDLGIDCVNNFNFAVCGSSGAGKSTFINCILQLQGDDAARVDVVECTPHIRGYTSAQYPSVVLWDMPGSDVQDHPSRSYFMDKKLYAFDCILILTSGSFSEVDNRIAIEAKRWNKAFAVVRTKADVDVKDIALRQRKSMKAAASILREVVLRSFAKQRDMPASTPLFIINSFALCNHYPNTYSYSFGGRTDNSLSAMDEARLLTYLLSSVKPRFRSPLNWPTLTHEGSTS